MMEATRSRGRNPVSVAVLGLLVVVFVGSAAMDDAVAAPQVLKHLGRASYRVWK